MPSRLPLTSSPESPIIIEFNNNKIKDAIINHYDQSFFSMMYLRNHGEIDNRREEKETFSRPPL